MNFDFKITTWERVNVLKEQEELILEKIKSGEIFTASQIFEFCADAECTKLFEVEEQMTVEENGGAATIEVMEDGEIIYQNNE